MWKSRFFTLLICCLSVGCESKGEIEYAGGANDGTVTKESGVVSIAYLKSFYERAPKVIDSELYIVGRLVSTDQHGSFYKRMVVEDDTGGITICVDIENYSIIYPYYPGAVLKIACNSLMISNYGGVLRLTKNNGAYLTEDMLPSIMTFLEGVELPPPLTLTIDAITPAHINRYVCFDNVQFESRGFWCEEGVPTDRVLVDRDGNRLNVRVSPETTFANVMLPERSGFIIGVLGIFNGVYQLEVEANYAAVMREERF